MLHSIYVIHSHQHDPYHNLALEELLLHSVKEGECILYLWQNERTVVIGRNQHAPSECHIQALEADGGHLARRLSGGGAVYHDLGNLNFTFLTCTKDFDVEKQTEVILRCVQRLGIHAEKTGRNDLTVDGKKFSGHAYYQSKGKSYHHGTLMVDVDKKPLEKYLHVSPLKLKARGVSSVRSRVVNLKEICPSITIEAITTAITAAFEEVYQLPIQSLDSNDLDQDRLRAGRAKFASDTWRYGSSDTLDHHREARFSWGTMQLDFSLADDTISQAVLYSDGLEADFLSRVPLLLKGCPMCAAAIQERLHAEYKGNSSMIEDISRLIVNEV